MKTKMCYLIDVNGFYHDLVNINYDGDAPVSMDAVIGTVQVPEDYGIVPVTEVKNTHEKFVKAQICDGRFIEGATAEEIAAWGAEHPAPQMIPSQSEKLRADVDFLSAMTGVQL